MKPLIATVAILALTMSLAVPAFAARRGWGRSASVRTQHSDQRQEASGAVAAVNIMKREIIVGNRTFNVPGYAPVTINGTRGQLMQAKLGDHASVSYTIHTTQVIRSGRGGRGRTSGSSARSYDTNTGKSGSIVAEGVTITR